MARADLVQLRKKFLENHRAKRFFREPIKFRCCLSFTIIKKYHSYVRLAI